MTLREAVLILSAHGHPPPLTFGRERMRLACAGSVSADGAIVADDWIETIPATRSALLAWLGY